MIRVSAHVLFAVNEKQVWRVRSVHLLGAVSVSFGGKAGHKTLTRNMFKINLPLTLMEY